MGKEVVITGKNYSFSLPRHFMFIRHGFQIVTHKDIHNQQLQPISIS